MNNQPIQRANIYEVVAERMMEEIASGQLHPGDPLQTEKELTERYGVGRSSVREALRRLESQRVICSNGKGGYVVGERGATVGQSLQMMVMLGHANLEELTELRDVVEVRSAGIAALRRTADDLAAIYEALQQMKNAGAEGPEMLEADLQFHLSIAAATQNSSIEAVAQGLRGVLRNLLPTVYRAAEEAIVQHEAIVEAIRNQDAPAAEEAMHTHLSWIRPILRLGQWPTGEDGVPIEADASSTVR